MFRTLDVSKLSGWLNFFASWGGAGREAGRVLGGAAAAHAACARKGSTGVWAQGWEECTLNISPMPVTRDVSKLTG